jgi:hypothetical protein
MKKKKQQRSEKKKKGNWGMKNRAQKDKRYRMKVSPCSRWKTDACNVNRERHRFPHIRLRKGVGNVHNCNPSQTFPSSIPSPLCMRHSKPFHDRPA